MEEQQLRSEIAAAFPAQPFFGRVTDCECEECADIAHSLQNKSWREVPDDFVDLTCSPALLTPAAFQAFVPAYMLGALELLGQKESNVVELTVYSLTPTPAEDDVRGDKAERLRTRAKLMTAEQIAAIRNFLSFVLGDAPDPEWLNTFIAPALSFVWNAPSEPTP